MPLALIFWIFVYLFGGWIGAEHPWRPRRYLANALMFVGILPWLLLLFISTGVRSLFSNDPPASEESTETPTNEAQGDAPRGVPPANVWADTTMG